MSGAKIKIRENYNQPDGDVGYFQAFGTGSNPGGEVRPVVLYINEKNQFHSVNVGFVDLLDNDVFCEERQFNIKQAVENLENGV